MISEQRMPTSLDLLTVFLLIQLRMLLAIIITKAHGWLTLRLLSAKTAKSFSADLLCIQPVPSPYCCRGWFYPRLRTSHLPLLNFISLLLVHSSNLPRSLWMQALPLSYCLLHQIWYHFRKVTCNSFFHVTAHLFSHTFTFAKYPILIMA